MVLLWTAINGADLYGVWYQNASGTWTALNTNVTNTTFTDTTAPANSTRVYAVRAYKGTTYSDFKPVTMPAIPQVTYTVASNGKVVLSWVTIIYRSGFIFWFLKFVLYQNLRYFVNLKTEN
jgi:hypothetical protein